MQRTGVLTQSNMELSAEENQMKLKLASESEHHSLPKRTLFLRAREARCIHCACKADFGLDHQLSCGNSV